MTLIVSGSRGTITVKAQLEKARNKWSVMNARIDGARTSLN